jgi:hypothetical protein
MLITCPQKSFSSFDEINQEIASLLKAVPAGVTKTIVFGPMDKGSAEEANNMKELMQYGSRLSEEGFAVVEIVSFQPAVNAIIEKRSQHLSPSELHASVLGDFTLKLISMKLLNVYHFSPRWETSPGSVMEHDEIEKIGGKIVLLPPL